MSQIIITDAITSISQPSSLSFPTCAQTCASRLGCEGLDWGCVCAACSLADSQAVLFYLKQTCNFSGYQLPDNCAAGSSSSGPSTPTTSAPRNTGGATSTSKNTNNATSVASGGVSAPSHRGLSSGAYAGIGIGVGLIVILLIGLLVLLLRRHVQISWKKQRASRVTEIGAMGGAGGKAAGPFEKDGNAYEVKHIYDEKINTGTNGNEVAQYELQHPNEATRVVEPAQAKYFLTEVDGESNSNVTRQDANVNPARSKGEELYTNSNRHEAQGCEVPAAREKTKTNANNHQIRRREVASSISPMTNKNRNEVCELPTFDERGVESKR